MIRNPKLKVLAAAIPSVIAIFAATGATLAHADTTITTSTGHSSWSSGNFSITNTGTLNGSNSSALYASNSVGTLTNNGVITGGNAFLNGGTIALLNNTGTIEAGYHAIYNNDYGVLAHINTLINSSTGVIVGGGTGIYNKATIGTLINNGSISGGNYGVLTNTSDTITNNNVIASNGTGVYLYASTNSLDNTTNGTITGVATAGVGNGGMAGTITNEGRISGLVGIANTGTIGGITNSGTITGSDNGLTNTGTIGALTNSGTISGSSAALTNSVGGVLPTLHNSGVFAGNINNLSAHDLTITGGTGSTFGTLTGYSGAVGTISNTVSNLVFDAGNSVLNDNIDVGATGTVTNIAATLAINSVLTVHGNYSQGAAATLLVGVQSGAMTGGNASSDAGYGRLVVSGSANIASGSSVTLKASSAYAVATGQRYVVVDAATVGTNYNASTLNYAVSGATRAILSGTTATSGTRSDLVVSVLSTDGTLPVTTTTTPGISIISTPTATPVTTSIIPTVNTIQQATLSTVTQRSSNSGAALSGLVSYTAVSSPALLNLYNASLALLDTGSSGSASTAGTQLSPVSQLSASRAAAAPTIGSLSVVSAHVDSVRLAQSDIGGGSGSSGIATGEKAAQTGVWGQAFGGHSSQNATQGIAGYSANYAGLLLGADRALSDRWMAGGVFSYSNAAVNNTGSAAGDNTRVNSYGAIAYAGYTANPWYANFSAGVVQQRYNENRQINFTGFSGSANGSFSGTQYVARGEVGYPIALRIATVTPLASVTYSYQHQDGYTESGGNGAGLTMGASHTTSVKSELGAKIERAYQTRYGILIPGVQAAWRHEFDHTRALVNASYAADVTGETGFSTLGANPTKDSGVLTAGITLLRQNNMTITAQYQLEAAPGYVSQGGTLRLRQLF